MTDYEQGYNKAVEDYSGGEWPTSIFASFISYSRDDLFTTHKEDDWIQGYIDALVDHGGEIKS